MNLYSWLIFLPVFFLVRWYVLRDHKKTCGCKKYDRTRLFSLPNMLGLAAGLAVAIVIMPLH